MLNVNNSFVIIVQFRLDSIDEPSNTTAPTLLNNNQKHIKVLEDDKMEFKKYTNES